MAISRFDQPAEQPVLNTYAPLPYEQLMGALKMKQAEQDNALKSLDDSQKLFDLKINKTLTDSRGNVYSNPDYEDYINRQNQIQQQINDLAGQDLTTGQYRNSVRNIARDTGGFIATKGRGYERSSEAYNKAYEDFQKLDDINKGRQGRPLAFDEMVERYNTGGGYTGVGEFKGSPFGKFVDKGELVNKYGQGINDEILELEAGVRQGKYTIEEYKKRLEGITKDKIQRTVVNPAFEEFRPIAEQDAADQARDLARQVGKTKDEILNSSLNSLSEYMPQFKNLSPQDRAKTFQQYILEGHYNDILNSSFKLESLKGDKSINAQFKPESLLKKEEGPAARETRTIGFNSNYGGDVESFLTTESGRKSFSDIYKEETERNKNKASNGNLAGGKTNSTIGDDTALIRTAFRFITGDNKIETPTAFKDNFELAINPRGEKLTKEQREKRTQSYLNQYNNTAVIIKTLNPNDPESKNTQARYNNLILGENNNGSGIINGARIWVIDSSGQATPLDKGQIDELNTKEVKKGALNYIGNLDPDNAIIVDANKPLERGLPAGYVLANAENPDERYIVEASKEDSENPANVIKSKILAGKAFPNEFTMSGEKYLSVPATDYDKSGALINTTDPDTGLPFKLYEIKNGKRVKVTNKNTLNKLIANR